jgi:ferredoxin
MAYEITSQCISCKLCLSVCPTGAIQEVDGNYWIDSELCTNCAGSIHTVPQCKASCPTVDGCVKQPSDYWERWFATYNRVRAKLTNEQDYWENWYNSYSQKIAEQLQKHQGPIVI